MPISPSIEKLHAIKEMPVSFTFGVESLDWSSEPIQCALCEQKYDCINFYLNNNSSQTH